MMLGEFFFNQKQKKQKKRKKKEKHLLLHGSKFIYPFLISLLVLFFSFFSYLTSLFFVFLFFSNIYHVPDMLHKQGLPAVICKSLQITPPIVGSHLTPSAMLQTWNQMAVAVDTFEEQVTIAVVGKYTGLSDAYLSVIKALKHSAIAANRKLHIDWVPAEDLEKESQEKNKEKYDLAWASLRAADGVHVPGGFGTRGIEGKILAANYARTSKTPYLGVCLGMQVAVIEWSRNMCNLKDANSAEFDEKTDNQVSITEIPFFFLLLYFQIIHVI